MIDISSQRFGRLTALKPEYSRGNNGKISYYWQCICDCGENKKVLLNNLRRGLTKSCGCLRKEASIERNTTHGQYGTKTYRSWSHMLGRCNCQTDKKYPRYGGRGISVCPQWSDFSNFLSDMGECPKGLTIDRIDNDGDYGPGNCRWATLKEQQNNRSTNRLIEYKGETLNVKQWATKLKMNYGTLQSRLDRGWSPERALTAKVGTNYGPA